MTRSNWLITTLWRPQIPYSHICFPGGSGSSNSSIQEAEGGRCTTNTSSFQQCCWYKHHKARLDYCNPIYKVIWFCFLLKLIWAPHPWCFPGLFLSCPAFGIADLSSSPLGDSFLQHSLALLRYLSLLPPPPKVSLVFSLLLFRAPTLSYCPFSLLYYICDSTAPITGGLESILILLNDAFPEPY